MTILHKACCDRMSDNCLSLCKSVNPISAIAVLGIFGTSLIMSAPSLASAIFDLDSSRMHTYDDKIPSVFVAKVGQVIE